MGNLRVCVHSKFKIEYVTISVPILNLEWFYFHFKVKEKYRIEINVKLQYLFILGTLLIVRLCCHNQTVGRWLFNFSHERSSQRGGYFIFGYKIEIKPN